MVGERGKGEDQQRVQVGTRVHEATIFWTFLGMGGAPRLLLLSVFFLLLLAQTELASYQTSIAEEEIPEERAGDEEEPGEQKFSSPCLEATDWNSSQWVRDQQWEAVLPARTKFNLNPKSDRCKRRLVQQSLTVCPPTILVDIC